MANNSITIGGVVIAPGEEKQINASISRLPTRTTIEIPIIVSRSKIEGPTVLFMGGMHGNEINGVEIVRRLIARGINKPLIGTTICIPILNIYGFIHSSREVPDGKDINRAFPGNRNGSLASQIAYHLRKEILPLIDAGVDFHTGGAQINNFPQIRSQLDQPEHESLARVFGTRFMLNANLREKSFRKEAQKVGKPILVFEGGESQRLRRSTIMEGVNGAQRVLKYLGMRDEAPEPTHKTITIERSSWVRARAAGLHHALVRVGEEVSKGAKIGLITGPFGDFERPIRSTVEGYVIAVNNSPVVNRGDALFHIGVKAADA